MSVSSVWHISREYRGLAEAGGIKDVVRDLAETLASYGIRISVVIPWYGLMDRLRIAYRELPLSFDIPLPDRGRRSAVERIGVRLYELSNVSVYCLTSARFSEKLGVYTYTDREASDDPRTVRGEGHTDALELGLLFQLGALELISSFGDPPSVIHCHDAHAAFVPPMMREHPSYREFFKGSGAVVTIHNAGPEYRQDVRDIEYLANASGIPTRALCDGMCDGAVNPFLVASRYAVLTTVSENYAKELLETDDVSFSGGLGRALRERSIVLHGITNGITLSYLDPRTPAFSGLPAGYDPSSDDLSGKAVCRRIFLERLASGRLPPALELFGSLDDSAAGPLYALQARITRQKGIRQLIEAAELLRRSGAGVRIAVLGQGEEPLERVLIRTAQSPEFAGSFCFIRGYQEAFVKLLFAAGDFFLIPSVYEPCGITDLFAQLTGTIPVVHRVGGLVKVVEGENGYTYDENTPETLASAIARSAEDFRHRPEKLAALRKNGFSIVTGRYTWDRIAKTGYLPLYEASRIGTVRR
jgi:starch synthase